MVAKGKIAPLERSHLQVLPLPDEVRAKTWMEAALSMTMHDGVSHGQALALCRKAAELSPGNPKNRNALNYYLAQQTHARSRH